MFVGVVVSFVAAAGGEGESTTRNCRLAWGLGREVGTRGEQSVNAQETIGSGGFGRFDETSGSRLEDARVRVRVCSARRLHCKSASLTEMSWRRYKTCTGVNARHIK